MCIEVIVVCPDFMNDVPDQYKTHEKYIGVAQKDPSMLKYVPDRFKTQKMCDDVVCREPYSLQFNPDNLKTQGICEKVVEDNTWYLIDVQEIP